MLSIALVAESAYKKGETEFRAASEVTFRAAPADEAALLSELQASGARIAVIGVNNYGPAVYETLAGNAAGRPALLARFGVGHDNVDKSLARRLGIVVTNTPGALDDSVAEHTLWMLGSLAKRLYGHERSLRDGSWAATTGIELRGKTLAVVGFGAIGRRVAAAAHFGAGMRVVAVGSRPAADFERREGRPLGEILAETGADEYTDHLDDALRCADAVTLHAPATAATRQLMNRDRLAAMRSNAFLINTARGALIDEAALYDILARGALGGAALDVFEHEPYRPVAEGKDLRTLANVLLTPHIGSNTSEANSRMANSVVKSVRSFLDGKFAELPRVDAD